MLLCIRSGAWELLSMGAVVILRNHTQLAKGQRQNAPQTMPVWSGSKASA